MENDSTTTDNIVAAKDNNTRKMGPVAENTTGDGTTAPTVPTDGQMGTPPEMNCDVDSENCEMPELPEGFDGEMPSDMPGGGFGGRGQFATQTTSNPDAIWHPVAYLAMGGCSVVLSILISYACFSKFFHLKPGQTFSKLSKFIWFVVVAIVLSVGLCTLGFFIPKWVG